MQWKTVGFVGALRASDGDRMDEDNDEDSDDKSEDDSDDDSEDEEEEDDGEHKDPYVAITASFVASTHLGKTEISIKEEEEVEELEEQEEEEEEEEEEGVWHELVDIFKLKPANP